MTSTFPRWKNDPEPAFVFELSRRLVPDFDVTVLAPRAPGSKTRETMDGLRVIRFSYFFRRWETLAMHGGGILNNLKTNPLAYLLVPFFFMGQLLAIVKLLCRERFDLIHAHWIIPQGFLTVIAGFISRTDIPMVCTSHGGDLFALRGPFFRWLKRIIINRSTAVTVVSSAMRDTVIDMGVSPDKVQVISMGVDLKNLFVPNPDVKRSDKELLFVGRLVEKKGVHILIRAMPALLKKHPDTCLSIAGTGPLEKELRELAVNLNVSAQVNFLGLVPQKHLPELYNRATIAVFPFVIAKSGDQEGFGLVQVEAMGCGCPVVSGDVRGVHDILIHKKTGLLVPPGKPKPMADAIDALLSNTDLRQALAFQARKRSVEKFDWNIVGEKYRELFKEIFHKESEASKVNKLPRRKQ